MPQTLLALAAILTFSVFALSQHRAKAGVEESVVTSEVEIVAGQLARDRLATVLALPFDDGDAAGTLRLTTSGLAPLGPDADDTAPDDVDDFNGLPARPVPTDWMGATLDFTDSVAVRYVDDRTLAPCGPGLGCAGPTLTKEVTVVVRAAPRKGAPAVAAELNQIVTPTL